MEFRHFSAHELVSVIRSNMSYSTMMLKYSLTAHQLDEVLAKLVERGMLMPEELPKKPAEPEILPSSPESPATQTLFTCPHCGKSKTYQFDECPFCGIIISKLKDMEAHRKHCPQCDYSQFLETTTCPRCGFDWVVYDAKLAAQHAEEAKQEAIKQQLELWRTHGIPEVPVPIVLKKGELGHYTSPVEVLQEKTQTKTFRTYIGSRLMLFKIPIYFGASTPHSYSQEVIITVGQGDFTITNKRVVLTGTKINYSTKLEKINGIQLYSDAVQLFDEGRGGGRFYKIADPHHAGMILAALLDN